MAVFGHAFVGDMDSAVAYTPQVLRAVSTSSASGTKALVVEQENQSWRFVTSTTSLMTTQRASQLSLRFGGKAKLRAEAATSLFTGECSLAIINAEAEARPAGLSARRLFRPPTQWLTPARTSATHRPAAGIAAIPQHADRHSVARGSLRCTLEVAVGALTSVSCIDNRASALGRSPPGIDASSTHLLCQGREVLDHGIDQGIVFRRANRTNNCVESIDVTLNSI